MPNNQIVYARTTEDHIWITLPFKIRERNLTKKQAITLAVQYRTKWHLARRLPDSQNPKRYLVATYRPRRNAPRSCDL